MEPPILVKPALSWVHYVSLAMAFARLPGSILLSKILDASWDAAKDKIVHGTTINVLPCSASLLAMWPDTGECISPTAILKRLVVQNRDP